MYSIIAIEFELICLLVLFSVLDIFVHLKFRWWCGIRLVHLATFLKSIIKTERQKSYGGNIYYYV